MNQSSSFNLKSHPDKFLIDHLRNVGLFCKKTIQSKKINSDIFNLNDEILANFSFITGVSHDFGKGTINFQNYINEKDEKQKASLKNNPETRHGLLSSLFTYFVIKESLKDLKFEFLPLLGYFAVKKHHGNLGDVTNEILDLKDNIEILKRQINSLCLEELKLIYLELLPNIDIIKFISVYESIIKEIISIRRNFSDHLQNEKSIQGDAPGLQYYLLTQLFYSILLNSDKLDASGIQEIDRNNAIPLDLVDNYRIIKGYDKPKNKMDIIRNEIYSDVIGELKTLSLDNNIYSLNVSTGTGKTLTVLSFSLKLRDKIKTERNFMPKIIYSLPFLSIIDQNFEVFEDVFKKVQGYTPTTDILLKHHHLSDIFYETNENVDYDTSESLLLIEGWYSEIIVTTFIQLFHSLISNKNRSLRKFHNIINSIVILDEVQSIPHEYWLLFKEVISLFSKCFNTYFIFVTATQPLIFDESKKEIVELVTNKKYYFDKFDRIELIPNLQPLLLDNFKEIIRSDVEKNKDNNFLIVLNTINSSKSVYQYLESLKITGTKLYYLSTNITPCQRLDRINDIRNNKARKIIVSTQLIEAGVDIDVDTVYRDFSTMDSINQVSGRCNRNYSEGKKGLVKLFILKDENKEYYRYIYSPFLIDKTKEVLKEAPERINENYFLTLSNNYFKKIKDSGSDDASNKILSFVQKLEFEQLYKNFKLIQDDYYKIDVFIELDYFAKAVWNQYKVIKELKNPIERKNEFLKIKKDFYEYVISIPKNKAPAPENENGIAYV
ncbi:MAG: CRISPR-associated helicase Cas3', partial [Candidatus Methanoperedens sp.]